MTTSTAKKRLSWRGRLGLIGVGLLFAVIVIELVGRAFHLMPIPPPETYYPLRAVVGKLPLPYENFIYRQEARPLDESEFVTWLHFNNHGMRDIDHDYEVPPGAERIMFLGDSFVAAWEVPLEETFVSLLRESLNALPDRPTDYDLVSAGFAGWGADRQYLFYREDGYRYGSDLVVLQVYVANDVLDSGIGVFDLPRGEQRPYFMLDENGEIAHIDYDDPKPQPYTADEQGFFGKARWWLNEYSFTYRLIRDGVGTLGEIVRGEYGAPTIEQPPDSPVDEEGRSPMELYREAFGPEYDQRWQDAWNITWQLIQALNEEVEARGGQLVVLLVPTREEQDPQLWQDVVERFDLGPEWDPNRPTQLYRAFLEEEGIPYLDMLPPTLEYVEATGHSLRFEIDPHWTTEGHCVVAIALQNWLLAEELITGPTEVAPRDPVALCAE